MSFGYSVGDVIAGANLTYRLIRIMSDTKGASEEYLEAMSELSAMQQAFLQISDIRSHKMVPAATVNAASFIVLSSMDVIPKFLERAKSYQRRLEDPRASTFQSSWYKVGWTLFKSHELHALRDDLHFKPMSVQLILSAASYCTSLPTTMTQYQAGTQNTVSSSSTPDQDNIKFRDAVGRKFSFPWNLCNTWEGMSDLIMQAFYLVDILGPHVIEGHYDLMSPDGDIILPGIWDKIAKPGMMITMTMWPMEKYSEPGTSIPVGWKVKSDTSRMSYLVDHNNRTIHRNRSDDGSHHGSGTSTALPMPPTPRSTAPGQVVPRVVENGTSFEYYPRNRRHSNNAMDPPEILSKESLSSKRELKRRVKELETITQPAIIEIVNDMKTTSRMSRAQSKTIIQAVKEMSLESFEDAINAWQAQMSCGEEGLIRNSLYSSAEEHESCGASIDGDKVYRLGMEDDGDVSVEGQDYETDALTSDSQDWEDCTDDEEGISPGTKIAGCPGMLTE